MALFVVCKHCPHLVLAFCSGILDEYLLVYIEGRQYTVMIMIAVNDVILPLYCALVTVLIGGLPLCLIYIRMGWHAGTEVVAV